MLWLLRGWYCILAAVLVDLKACPVCLDVRYDGGESGRLRMIVSAWLFVVNECICNEQRGRCFSFGLVLAMAGDLGRLSDALARFRDVFGKSRDALLMYGAEDAFVQFGPLVVAGRYILFPAVVTDRCGSRRARVWLGACSLPHMTVGFFAEGRGWLAGHSRAGRWCVSEPPSRSADPKVTTLVWSKVLLREVDVSRLILDANLELLESGYFDKPQAALIRFDDVEFRCFISGGVALDVYRHVQARLSMDSRGLHVSCCFRSCLNGLLIVRLMLICSLFVTGLR